MIPIAVTSYKIHKSSKLIDMTLKCLKSTARQKESKTFLFDDCSDLSDSIREFSNNNNITIVKSDHNNLSKLLNDICNFGFYKYNSNWICIINNDIELVPNTISDVASYISKNTNELFIWATEICNPPHKFAAFSAFVINKSFYETIGVFDERFDFFYCDSDYEARSYEKFGYIPFHQIDTFKVHHETSTSKHELMDFTTHKIKYLHAAGIFKQKWGEIMYSPETKDIFFKKIRKQYLEKSTEP